MASNNLPAVREDGPVALQTAPRAITLLQEFDPETAARALAILAAQPADRPLSPQRAIAAALHESATGQKLNRDFYVDERMGIVQGYRGLIREAAEAGLGEWTDDYRPLTAEENEEHEVKPGDTARVCLLTVYNAAKAARAAGLPYRPVERVGIIRASEKRDRNGQPIALKGGFTWAEKAKNRALKAALRHAGFAATAREILDDAGIEVPEDAQLTVHQAQAAARSERFTGPVPKISLGQPAGFRGFGDDDDGPDPFERVQSEPEPAPVVPHWSDDATLVQRMHRYASNNGLDDDAVLAALEVENLREFAGTVHDAKALIDRRIEAEIAEMRRGHEQ